MSNNLKIYTSFSLLWSILFFALLNWGVMDADHRWPIMWTAAFAYGCGFAAVGKHLGRSEKGSVRYNIRAAYVAISTLSSALIGSLWILFFHPEQWLQIIMFALIAGGFTWHVFVKYNKSVKGMKKEELFK